MPKDYVNDETFMVCSKCGSPMNMKHGSFGYYYACSGYPRCKNTTGCYSTPDEVSFAMLAINQAFGPFIRSYLFDNPDISVTLDYISQITPVTEKNPGYVKFTPEGVTIVLNQFYNFKTKFDMIDFLVKRYVTAWTIMEKVLFDMNRFDEKNNTEAKFMLKIPEDDRKKLYGNVATTTYGIMDQFFNHVFGVIQKTSQQITEEKKSGISYPF